MTDADLCDLRDREIIVLQLSREGLPDALIAGCCVLNLYPDPCFFTSHPLAPMRTCFKIEDSCDFSFFRTGKTIDEALGDTEFANYYAYAKNHLELPEGDTANGFVVATAALFFEQAAHISDLKPEYFDGPQQLPLGLIEPVINLAEIADAVLLHFCRQYRGDTDAPGRLH